MQSVFKYKESNFLLLGIFFFFLSFLECYFYLMKIRKEKNEQERQGLFAGDWWGKFLKWLKSELRYQKP